MFTDSNVAGIMGNAYQGNSVQGNGRRSGGLVCRHERRGLCESPIQSYKLLKFVPQCLIEIIEYSFSINVICMTI